MEDENWYFECEKMKNDKNIIGYITGNLSLNDLDFEDEDFNFKAVSTPKYPNGINGIVLRFKNNNIVIPLKNKDKWLKYEDLYYGEDQNDLAGKINFENLDIILSDFLNEYYKKDYKEEYKEEKDMTTEDWMEELNKIKNDKNIKKYIVDDLTFEDIDDLEDLDFVPATSIENPYNVNGIILLSKNLNISVELRNNEKWFKHEDLCEKQIKHKFKIKDNDKVFENLDQICSDFVSLYYSHRN